VCEWSCEVVGPGEAGVRALDYSYLPPNGRRSLIHVVHQQQVACGTNDKANQIRLAASVLQTSRCCVAQSRAAQRTAASALLHPESDVSCCFWCVCVWSVLLCPVACSLDSSRFGNVSSFVRSACDGSLAAVLLHTAASPLPRVLLLARRDIARGEELTLAHDGQDCAKHSLQLHATPDINLYTPAAAATGSASAAPAP